MQILESSDFGLRSAVLTLRRRETQLRFILFPMVHLAEPAFYDAVAERLRICDLIVAEGVKGESAPMSLLTASYRLAGSSSRLGLVVQSIDFGGLGVPVIYPDLTGQEFSRQYSRVPLGQRFLLGVAGPVVGLGIRLFASRELLGSHLAMDDLPTPTDELIGDMFTEHDDVVVDRRDTLVVDALTAIHDERHSEPITVAVVYGAGHVPGVVNALGARLHYLPRSAEWLTVFEY
ncbi:hypothetical protein [Flindersiella endophytica]